MNRAEISAIVANAVRNQLEMGGDIAAPVDDDTILLGSNSVVDSLGLVNVIIEVEQVLLDEHDASIILVDEKAMSLRNSPFRTVGSLTEYASELIAADAGA